MTVTLDKTHELKGSAFLLGVGGENESEQLVINIAYDVLLDKWAYIEFEQNGKPYTTERLAIANGQIVYAVPNGLLVRGDVFVQAVFRDASGFVWKSFKKKCLVTDDINACNNYPQTYPDFITEAQTLLDEISVESEKVDAVLITEESRTSAEAERVESEATREANEVERVENETERESAETARATAEHDRQIAETARADAETARRTEFASWADSIGSLSTYDKRLINLEEAGVGILFGYQTDDATAYSKTVPANALPYARLIRVGGMTYKADNALIDTRVKSVGGNAIPEAVRLLDGYGLGIDDTCYNYIDFERKIFVKRVGVVDLGGLTWSYLNDVGHERFVSLGINSLIKKPSKDSEIVTILCMTYKADRVTSIYAHITDKAIGINTNGNINIYDAGYVDITTFKAAMNGVYLYYELATPIETDISAYLTDNYIKVEPNGTIVFENDATAAVPSEIVYTVKR